MLHGSVRSRTRSLCLVHLLLLCVPLACSAADGAPSVEKSVVQVFVTAQFPVPLRPWTRQPTRQVTGSGVVVEGRHILTNAHVVAYASVIQVMASDSGTRVNASVEAVAPDMDLALLRVEDPSFFDQHPALPLAQHIPAVKDRVLVYGFALGASTLSITQGIVSRIDFTGYQYPAVGLRIQIDAAVNSGNSGGPALVDDRMIGIARSGLANAQNVNYIIPSEEIQLFLRDLADGRYDGKPFIFDDLQPVESPLLRAYLKLPADSHGMMVRRPNDSLPGNPLREWDVITHIGDTPIDDQGMVQLEGGLRLRFPYMLQKLGVRDAVPLTVVRDGKPQKLQMPLATDRVRLVPDLDGSYPPYFIYGPVVFSKVTAQMVAELSRTNPTQGGTAVNIVDVLAQGGSPLVTMRNAFASAERQELVFIPSGFFPHPLTTGYRSPTLSVVDSVNGRTIKSLAHLVETLRDLKDEQVVLRFMPGNAAALVLPRKEVEASTQVVLEQNGIREFASPDLLKIWSRK